MALSVFEDREVRPSEGDLGAALGAAAGLWRDLIAAVNRVAAVEEVWGFTGKSTGWGLRLRSDGRVIVYMTPQRGQFLASFVLGERAMVQARNARLRGDVHEVLVNAKRYAEGYGVRLTVRKRADLAAVESIARIKLES